MPGCSTPVEHCDLHHITRWTHDNGPTDLSNGVPLCPPCHRHLHNNHLAVRRDPDLTVTIIDSRSHRHPR
jgi:hypothetical protein